MSGSSNRKSRRLELALKTKSVFDHKENTNLSISKVETHRSPFVQQKPDISG